MKIKPGETVSDLLVFDPPGARATAVELFLPGDNIQLKGETFRMTIPKDVMELPENVR